MKARFEAVALLLFALSCGRAPTSARGASPPPASVSSPPPSPTAAVAAPACRTPDLAVQLSPAGAAAGSTFEWLELTNESSASCALYGYPGVSLVDASGNQLGSPAERNGVYRPSTVFLGHAYALLQFPNPANFPPGRCSGPAASLRVYPPGNTQALLLPSSHPACPGFSVSALVATRR